MPVHASSSTALGKRAGCTATCKLAAAPCRTNCKRLISMAALLTLKLAPAATNPNQPSPND